jgi:tetratricopeptide (TPR) repeat protein
VGLFLVTRGAGPGWDPLRERRAQDGWDEHAAFMDGLVDAGAVVLGGPVGPTEATLVLRAADGAEVERLLEPDPWTSTRTLVTLAVSPWELLLGELPAPGDAEPRPDWEASLDALWASFDEVGETGFVARMEALAAELPDEAVALFEQASAHDSVGNEQRAVELYERALERGLGPERRRRAVIQLASSLRNVGRTAEGLALLEAERARGPDELDDAVGAFLALLLADSGREREAVSVALTALARHLPRYRRSVTSYAGLLLEPRDDLVG